MAIINKSVRRRLDEYAINVFFVSGRVAKWWNARRSDKSSEVCLLGGWYWISGSLEHGPFRTPSGAQRDAYYRMVLKQSPPLLDDQGVRAAEDDLKSQEKAAKAKEKVLLRRLLREERRVS